MARFVTRNGVPESGRCAALASETGTPRWVESSVSAQPVSERASMRTDPRVTRKRITQLLEADGARHSRARPVRFQELCDPFSRDARSEEHTSELQSRLHLVCPLLLAKKKTQRTT